jgi:hypothetical protein
MLSVLRAGSYRLPSGETAKELGDRSVSTTCPQVTLSDASTGECGNAAGTR